MSKIVQQFAASKERKNIINTDKPNVSKTTGAKLSVKIGQTRAQENKRRKLDSQSSGGKNNTQEKESRVIYLGHVPNGFGETEMRRFFSQFGLVKRIKLFRSAKTGGSKGYAFVEFDSAETAKVVSEAMNGYYLLERQITSHVIPLSKHHEGMFKASKKRKLSEDSESEEEEDKIVTEMTAEKLEKKVESLRSSLRNKQKKLNDLGIDFEIAVPV